MAIWRNSLHGTNSLQTASKLELRTSEACLRNGAHEKGLLPACIQDALWHSPVTAGFRDEVLSRERLILGRIADGRHRRFRKGDTWAETGRPFGPR